MVEQLAQAQGKSTMDAFLDLSLDEDLQTYFICVDRNTDVEAQRQNPKVHMQMRGHRS